MKRFFCLLMVLVMVISLFACKSNPDSEELAGLDTEVGISGESEDSGESGEQEEPSQTPDQPSADDKKEDQTPSENKNEKEPSQSEGEQKEPSGESNKTPAEDQPEEEEDELKVLLADKSGTKIKIMSQNLRYDAKEDRQTDNRIEYRRYRFQVLMEKYDPDVIGLQECDETWINYLREDYGAKYTMFYQYRGSTDGSDEATPIMWKTDKYTLVDKGYFWLSDTPNVASASFVKNSHPRIVTWVKLKDKQTGAEFNIYSAHMGFYEEDAHIDKIRELIAKSFKKNGDYSFIMGDFNFVYEDSQYYRMMQSDQFGDLRNVAQFLADDNLCTLGEIRKGTYNNFKTVNGYGFGDHIWGKPNENVAIDSFGYCYDRPAVSARDIPEGYVSDHYAVLAEVRIGTQGSYADYWELF